MNIMKVNAAVTLYLVTCNSTLLRVTIMYGRIYALCSSERDPFRRDISLPPRGPKNKPRKKLEEGASNRKLSAPQLHLRN